MLEKILIGATLGVIAVLVVIALQPADYRVTRAAVIEAPPAAVFARVTDLRQFQTWNPFARMDPNAKNTFEGAPAGLGAAMAWSGNKNIGEGRMTIVESRPHELVRMRLDFMRPFASTAFAEFTFAPDDGRTAVTWSMAGRNNFMAKAIHLIVNMDRMIGGQFEHGLAALKLQAEAKSAARL
jgi:uncharacterized protein YndB with AHSA1/START domain